MGFITGVIGRKQRKDKGIVYCLDDLERNKNVKTEG